MKRTFPPFAFVRARVPAIGIGQSPAVQQSGTLSVVRTIEGNFAAGVFDLDVKIPAGYLYFPQVVGLVLSRTDTVGVIGQLRFGIPTDRDLYLPATTVTITEDWEREEWFIREASERYTGVSELSAGLAASGLLTQAFGYMYFVGLMVKK